MTDTLHEHADPTLHQGEPLVQMIDVGKSYGAIRALKGINLTIVEVAGQQRSFVTPLTALQQSLLALWGLPSDLYQRLTVQTRELPSEPHQGLSLHFAEPPPI